MSATPQREVLTRFSFPSHHLPFRLRFSYRRFLNAISTVRRIESKVPQGIVISKMAESQESMCYGMLFIVCSRCCKQYSCPILVITYSGINNLRLLLYGNQLCPTHSRHPKIGSRCTVELPIPSPPPSNSNTTAHFQVPFPNRLLQVTSIRLPLMPFSQYIPLFSASPKSGGITIRGYITSSQNSPDTST